MLRDSLRLIASGEVASTSELARRLGVTGTLAEQMLDQLVRLGYLRAADPSCGRRCQGCPIARSCGGLPEVFSLTEQGKAALAHREP
ncbi:MAG: hypothetical protein HPY83_03255 [Anaerolineae bacterium]|nr:hypothetical protein [Anaerolineae bacterium]